MKKGSRLKTIISFKEKLCESFLLSFEESERHFTNYAIAVIIGIFGFYIFNLWVHNRTGYENFLLRLFSAILAFLLIIRSHWPAKLKPLLSWYWYFTLIYTLPFFFTFMLLHNASSNIWQINGLIGLVILALFVDWVVYIILVSIGCGAGLFAYYLTQHGNVDFISSELRGVILNYIAPIIYIMLFSTKRENIQQEKQKSLKVQAAAIAHEMRTPLFSINTIAHSLNNYMPILVKAYNQLKDSKGGIETISPRHLQFIREAPDTIAETTQSAFAVIDMLLVNLRDNPLEGNMETCSILDCMESALKSYPLTLEEKSLISVDIKGNFYFKGSQNLMIHVLFNLLKNALYYVKSSGEGNIYLWMEPGQKINRLYFKDTGSGIPKQKLPYIFDRFYSQTKYGTGIGLSFCRLVMRGIGGDITCDSVEGKFTQFTLSFPVIQKDEERK